MTATDGKTTACRALVGGFGRPGMRDLDFGRQVIDYLQHLDWPDGVVVEDLSCSAPLVLHRLQELRPAKVVLLGAVPREFDPPATLRRYRVDLTPPAPADVHRSLEESAMGMVDLDHTLAMARHWGGLPVDTVIIEIEPAEAEFGIGFSDLLAECFDPILDMVREELVGIAGSAGGSRHFEAADASLVEVSDTPATAGAPRSAEPSEDMAELIDYARDHAQARHEVGRSPALLDRGWSDAHGVTLAGRVHPWGVFVGCGGDWVDAVPLGSGGLGIVIGNVAGRGVEVAPIMSDLRAAARAYAAIDGDSPVRVMQHLDRLAETTGLGQLARVLYLTLHPDTGEIRFSNAGGCPPLVLDRAASHARFIDTARSDAVGAMVGVDRPEATLRLDRGSTLMLFTDGLVESRATSRTVGLERLRMAVTDGPQQLDDLCDFILSACTTGLRRDDDMCLVGLRLDGPSRNAHVPPSYKPRLTALATPSPKRTPPRSS